jgi:hypothetical protein
VAVHFIERGGTLINSGCTHYKQQRYTFLERVQRRATKMVEECKGMDYEERDL